MSRYVVGKTYIPDQGEHEGHRIRIVSTDSVAVKTPLAVERQVRHVLVRCEVCGSSWTFGDESRSDHWGDG